MLSIIIPTLNEEKYLPILLSQIKKQNFSDYEIIVADAGSSDKTVEIAKSFGCKVVKGGLPSKGRNEGAKIAKGDIFLFMDADNIYLPDGFFEKVISDFEKRNLGVASFPIYPKGNLIDKICYFFYNKFIEIFQNWIALGFNSVLMRKEIFEKIGGFDEKVVFAEDYDVIRRAAKISKFGFIKTRPVLTSSRRFERDGRLKTYGKYLLAGIYILLFGSIKKPIFDYKFDYLKNPPENVKSKLMELPKAQFQMEYPKLEKPKRKRGFNFFLLFLVLIAFLCGVVGGVFISTFYSKEIERIFSNLKIGIYQQKIEKLEKKVEKPEEFIPYLPQTSQEEAIIKVVKEASPAVVSVIISKDIPKLKLYYEEPFKEFEEFFGIPFEFKIPQFKQEGFEKKEIGGGTAFFISEDGMLLTNAHVVSDKEADYTVLTNDGKRYSAKVLARDTIRDLAILKVEGNKFPTLKLGDSDKLEIGQTVIAIGNALGEFRNTVSVGVISGLGRRVTASGRNIIETIEDVIQTDAAINRGNSGGPLLNLKGEVIGVNFAMAAGAENIGFAIPINKAKKAIEQVKTKGKIVFPFLGVRYVIIDDQIQKENNLPVNYGAWIVKGKRGESAIFPGSVAEKAGLKEGDIILEFNGEKITTDNSLAKIIMKYNPGDKVTLKILREKKEFLLEVVLGDRSE
jgi:S1-C subfamily serine protease/glycosyltransferase involved in cell wall biosynthesis